MQWNKVVLSSLLLAIGACTRPPPNPPGVEEQPATTPKTPAQEPTWTPPGSAQDEWPQAEQIGPEADDPDTLGTSRSPDGVLGPDEAPAQRR